MGKPQVPQVRYCPADTPRTGLSVEPDVEAVKGEDGLPSGHHGKVHRVRGVITHLPGAPPHPSTFRPAIAHVSWSHLPSDLLDMVPPYLGHLGIQWDRAMRGNGGQMRPCPGHDVDDRVAATAERDPLAAADLVSKIVNGLV